jgi:branched-chain amino acid transport system ATP-binding protein
MLIDEPSIGLSPIMIAELFAILRRLRAGGITVLMIEQNAKRARELSDETVVLELGRAQPLPSGER